MFILEPSALQGLITVLQAKGFTVRNLGQHRLTILAPHFEKKVMQAVVHHFRERKIKSLARMRPCVHGRAEACSSGLDAIHSNEKRLFAERRIMRVGI